MSYYGNGGFTPYSAGHNGYIPPPIHGGYSTPSTIHVHTDGGHHHGHHHHHHSHNEVHHHGGHHHGHHFEHHYDHHHGHHHGHHHHH
ncbi:unnamed protein product [Caenorhabditis sp. 36 PRJEB53466]|nr:unnamed protein product [Caenorhabditis sp. 36 PRJEB53466]